MVNNDSRHSVAQEAQLVSDPAERAEIEVLNGLKQYDSGVQVIQDALDRGNFKLRPSLILSLHREALRGLSSFAGNFRPANVEIQGSSHEPIGAHLVAELVEEMCDYVNENWGQSSAIHLSAYLMWRLNWIHPFADGNGRTSRIISYVVLCIKTESMLPGTPTIPEQIVGNRDPYFDALDSADAAYKSGKIDVSEMEKLLSGMLAEQLKNVYQAAGGNA
ncbi:MAG: Fic family protein [Rhizobiaceae bacterium]|nr:Fic family protein [Rhizobiaceae bacterium]MBL4695475.1 Fic family protein [Rhizobiaceae bacterium]